jgi:uncharacterized protein (TIGR03435 family)
MTRRSAIAIGLAGAAWAQEPAGGKPLAFEVAAVRRNRSSTPMPPPSPNAPPPPPPPPLVQPSPGGLTIENASLQYCLAWAYRVRPSQISGPGWMEDNHYDIHARAAGPVTIDQLQTMLQTLLTDRFRLTVRRDTKEARVLALVQAPGGSKLTPSKPGTPSTRNVTRGSQGAALVTARNLTLDSLAGFLELPIWDPIVDQTGLSGGFDFTFDRPAREGGDPDRWLVDLTAALQSQLGLRLKPAKVPMENIVIEHADPNPIEN